jgi:ABC-type glycerol-3-phosphate transport system substrate-binding protein
MDDESTSRGGDAAALGERKLSRGNFVKGTLALTGAAVLGGAAPGAAVARPFITKRRVSVNLWTWAWITNVPNTSKDIASIAFEKAYPNVDLTVRTLAYPDYLTTLKTAVPNGTVSEVFAIPTLAQGRLFSPFMEPLDGLVEKEWGKNWQKPFRAGVIDTIRKWDKSKKLLGLPTFSSTGGFVWYSRDAFAKAGARVPTSYADMKVQAAKLKGSGFTPMAWGAKDQWPNADYLIILASQWRPNAVADAENGKISFAHSSIVNALEFMRESMKDGIYNDAPFATTAFPEAYGDFNSGKAAMVITGTWYTGAQLATPGAQENWRGFLFPHVAGATAKDWLGATTSGYPDAAGKSPSRAWATVNIGYAMKKGLKSDKKAAALDFILHQAGRKGQQINAGWSPTTRTDVHLHNISPGLQRFLKWENSLYTGAEQRDFLYASVQDALQNAIADVCVNGASAKSALERVDPIAKTARARG